MNTTVDLQLYAVAIAHYSAPLYLIMFSFLYELERGLYDAQSSKGPIIIAWDVMHMMPRGRGVHCLHNIIREMFCFIYN
jgi:hypothetical protein